MPAHRSALPRQLIADLSLIGVTAIWGATFVMVKSAVANYPVFAFLSIRFALALLFLLPALLWRRRTGRQTWHRPTLRAGVLVGLALFAGYAFQTFGLQYTTPAKAGFITGLSVVMVPLFSAALLRQAPDRAAVAGVIMATAGLALLTWQGELTVVLGDILVLACAVSFAMHIIALGAFSPRMDSLTLLAVQIATVMFLSLGISLLTEWPWPALPAEVMGAAAFTGVAATTIAFGIQTVAQRFTSPTHTALIFAMEPVWAGLFSFWLIGERLGPRSLAGAGLILAGMLVAELMPALWRPGAGKALASQGSSALDNRNP
jgi:drug/metabolite transporter (DMT)-like permease